MNRPLLLLGICVVLLVGGCVRVDRYADSCVVRNGANAEQVKSYIRTEPSVTPEHAAALREGRLQVGMPWSCVVAAAGAVLKQDAGNPGTWRLIGQRSRATSGLYPYFDGRTYYLYEQDGRLVAIVERGEYNVYP